jgi:hypothetical protein
MIDPTDPTISAVIQSVTALAATLASGILGAMKRQLNRLEKRVDRLERAHGLETEFYYRKKKREKPKSPYRYAAILSALVLLLFLVGCANPPGFLFTRTQQGTNAPSYSVSPAARTAITATGSAAGPWGQAIAYVVLLGLSGWANFANRKALREHIETTEPTATRRK